MSILKIMPHSPKTLIWWYNRRSEIDFDPPYQRRGRLWSQSDKAFLIDSIINGFDVPKLYLADFQIGQSRLNITRKPYAIIDGKQRLEAIFDFFDNRLLLNASFKSRENPGLQVGGLSLRDLRGSYPRLAEEFENASLDIMSVFAEDEEDINDIFVRLNKSKPLTGAEIRNAVIGPVSDVTRSLVDHQFFQESIRFRTNRAADLNAAAKILLFEYEGCPLTTKKKQLDEFANSEIDREKLELAARRVFDNLEVMSDIFLVRDPLLSSAGVIPVYYWFIRGVDPERWYLVREFLTHFDARRRNNREHQKSSGGQGVDKELARFDTLNRSTNDESSHIGRLDILKRFFDDWVEDTLGK
jgi:hypothetical protein